MNLKVRRRIGYPGQGKRPPYPDEAEYDLRDGLLDPVLERGSAAFRQAPPASDPGAARDAPAGEEGPAERDARVRPTPAPPTGAPTTASPPAEGDPGVAATTAPPAAASDRTIRPTTASPTPAAEQGAARRTSSDVVRSRADRDDRPDVLVIGAGAAGSIATLRLARAGFRVVCLEQGGWANPSDFPGDKLEWELLVETRWSPDPNVRRLPADYPLEVSDSPITPIMFNAVGGSTVHFGAQWARMRPSDFKVRSVDGIADDWPLSYEELEPFYERVDEWMQIAGVGGDPAYPPAAPPPLPPLPIGAIGRKAAEGMNELGWHWWPAHHAIRSVAVGSLAACERTGTCMWGCPKGAKGSTDTTLWPEALRLGARLVTGARVRAITTRAGLANGALYVDREGREHRQEADVVVVACNGIGTPRLLLLSGLANSSGLVGKRLMLHPYMSVLGIYDEPLESWLGPWGTQLLSLQFADTDESRGFPRGAQWDVMPTGGPLMALARWDDLSYEERWGPAAHVLVEKTLGRAFDWGVGIEDLPHESNAVSLDPDLTDASGIAAPRITYGIDADARANLAFQLDRAREAHEAAGAVETRVTDWSQWGWHLLGTARMGGDPRTSVVDRWGRVHDVPNLYVLDGSVFVTSGPMAPTATICANALRCTERLIECAALQKTPV
jgi:choline dehydrogenase-like flavoprotein